MTIAPRGDAFGHGRAVAHLVPPRAGPDDVRWVRRRLDDLVSGSVEARLELMVPPPTAAFSGRDARRPGYPAARRVLLERGFVPMVRPVGGHLAIYDEGALVIHLMAPHRAPREHVRERFAAFSEVLADGLRDLGVDARVGPVPGEYCDGEFSVSDAGRAKLVGVGQRIVRAGYLLSAVVSIGPVDRVRAALAVGYDELGLDLRPETVGSVMDTVPGVDVHQVRSALLARLRGLLPVGSPQTVGLPDAPVALVTPLFAV
ncbi:lipoyl protein ligase domain-containing protein [Nocardioides sp.]|uniref:lipoyl protein ligase domain-containing protein n=1 Tax=Nocardioides sp. TaxID=35761 RepID=UPI0039E566A0